MYNFTNRYLKWVALPAALMLLFCASTAQAVIEGVSGAATTPSFNLRAKSGHLSTGDGSSVFFWGYADDGGGIGVQYPGPTMIVNEGDVVTVNLLNELSEATSIVFPGQEVTATGGVPGLLTREAPPDRLTSVTYTFTASQPGTYTYYSGTRTDLQVEMGLVGALIVRPATQDLAGCSQTMSAYGDCRSAYDHEYLFLLSEMDPLIHDQIEFGQMASVNSAAAKPVLWFINGRNAPDTMGANYDVTLPTQPYNILPRMRPGERMLARFIGAGRDLHPYHTHGNNFDLIARDGRLLLESGLGSKPGEVGILPDLAVSDFTLTVAPGATYDTIFTWTGKELGWDFYGHSLSDVAQTNGVDPVSGEIFAQSTLGVDLSAAGTSLTLVSDNGFPTNRSFRAVISAVGDSLLDQAGLDHREVVIMTWTAPNTFNVTRAQEDTTGVLWASGSFVSLSDHGASFPVALPSTGDIVPGAAYSGSPFLGAAGFLPPGEGGNNANSGFFYMWHSHNEREMINFDIFPGGMMTMMIVEPPNVAIP